MLIFNLCILRINTDLLEALTPIYINALLALTFYNYLIMFMYVSTIHFIVIGVNTIQNPKHYYFLILIFNVCILRIITNLLEALTTIYINALLVLSFYTYLIMFTYVSTIHFLVIGINTIQNPKHY